MTNESKNKFPPTEEISEGKLETIPASSDAPIKRRTFLTRSTIILGSAAGAVWFGHRHREQAISIWTRIAHLGDAIEHSQGVRNSKPRSPIPDQADVKDYRSYLAKDRQTFLSPDEILRPHFKYRSGVCSGVPPRHLWANMVRTARVANEIRNRLGVRLDTVVSAYRSPAYNSRCPGASKYSQHLQNRALDLIFDCPPKYAFDMACKLRDEGFFKGGIGLYSNFIHIDTRGRNATWGT